MSLGEFIFVIVGIICFTLIIGRYAIREGQRIEEQKKFIKNMENFDKKSKK